MSHRLAVVALALLAILTALGPASQAFAQPTETDRRAWEEFRKKRDQQRAPKDTVPAPKAPERGKPTDPRAPSDGVLPPKTDRAAWSVVIAVFRGEDHAREAQQMLARVRSEGRLPEARAQRRGPATLITVGSFSGPDDADAQRELKRVHALEVNGDRPYPKAYLAPPEEGPLDGQMPQFNLAMVRGVMGPSALYTLQVGVYGRRDLPRPSEADLAEARRAAEQAALRLRQEGEQAFYYHGPRMSMVTVGVFNIEDFDPQVPSYKSPRLTATQKRFPYNLYNGKGVNERVKGGNERLQPSNLVAIPESRE